MNDLLEKFCVNCLHYRLAREQPAGSQHRCARPISDLVTGKSYPHDVICEMERQDLLTTCGPAGKFWKPRA